MLFVWWLSKQSCFLSADIERDSNWRRRELVAVHGVGLFFVVFFLNGNNQLSLVPHLTKHQPGFNHVAARPFDSLTVGGWSGPLFLASSHAWIGHDIVASNRLASHVKPQFVGTWWTCENLNSAVSRCLSCVDGPSVWMLAVEPQKHNKLIFKNQAYWGRLVTNNPKEISDQLWWHFICV